MTPAFLSLAFRSLWKRKLRTALTLLGIVIAIATLVIIVSLALGLQAAVSEQFRELGTDKFFIFPEGQIAGPGSGGAVQFTLADVDVVDKVSGVKDLSYAVAGNAKVEFAGSTRYTQVLGIPTGRGDVFTESGAFKIDEGRFLKKGDRGVVGLGSDFKYRSFFAKPVHAGDKITINGREFNVKAIMQPRGNPGDDRIILIPFEDFQEMFGTGEKIDQIVVQAESTAAVKEVAARVEKKLRSSRHVTEKTQDFTVLTPEELLASFGNILTILTTFLLSIAAISMLVGGIGIATTMYTSVLERTRDIGIMKAVGARNQDVLSLFLLESGLLGLFGGVLGVVLGIAVSKIIEHVAATQLGTALVQAEIPVWLVLGCLLFAFSIGSLSGFWPAWSASRLAPTEALRYE